MKETLRGETITERTDSMPPQDRVAYLDSLVGKEIGSDFVRDKAQAEAEAMAEYQEIFDQLKGNEASPEAKAKEVLSQFAKDKILARAMSPLTISRNDNGDFGINFEVWDEELQKMRESEQKYTSSTLLVKGEKVPTYKAYGFLMDADSSVIAHIAESDSGSNGNTEEDFRANQTDLENLDQLAQLTRETHSTTMNEVNAHFSAESIKGLFVNDSRSPAQRIEALIAQRKLAERGVDLPMFKYVSQEGNLEEWQPTDEEKSVLVDSFSGASMREVYRRELLG